MLTAVLGNTLVRFHKNVVHFERKNRHCVSKSTRRDYVIPSRRPPRRRGYIGKKPAPRLRHPGSVAKDLLLLYGRDLRGK